MSCCRRRVAVASLDTAAILVFVLGVIFQAEANLSKEGNTETSLIEKINTALLSQPCKHAG